jgi:hypothetical protein
MTLQHVAGILVGWALTATRTTAYPIASHEALKRWTNEQADLLSRQIKEAALLFEANKVLALLGSKDNGFPISMANQQFLTKEEPVNLVKPLNEVILIDDGRLWWEEKAHGRIKLHSNVIVTSATLPGIVRNGENERDDYLSADWPRSEITNRFDGTLEGAVLSAIASAWDTSTAELGTLLEENVSTDIGVARDVPIAALASRVSRSKV